MKIKNVLWIDTETTGLDPNNSGVFEIGVSIVVNGQIKYEDSLKLNPLSETILFSEEAAKINGVSKEEIESYTPEKDFIGGFISLLKENMENEDDKYIFAGYNVKFDFGFIKTMFERYGYNIDDYVGCLADVFEQVKEASFRKAIPYLQNRKLTTLCDYFGIDLKNAHTALADIKATKELSVKLSEIGISLLSV